MQGVDIASIRTGEALRRIANKPGICQYEAVIRAMQAIAVKIRLA